MEALAETTYEPHAMEKVKDVSFFKTNLGP